MRLFPSMFRGTLPVQITLRMLLMICLPVQSGRGRMMAGNCSGNDACGATSCVDVQQLVVVLVPREEHVALGEKHAGTDVVLDGLRRGEPSLAVRYWLSVFASSYSTPRRAPAPTAGSAG